VEAGGIEPPSKNVVPIITTSVFSVLYLDVGLCRDRLAKRPVRFYLVALGSEQKLTKRSGFDYTRGGPYRLRTVRCTALLGSESEVVFRSYFFTRFLRGQRESTARNFEAIRSCRILTPPIDILIMGRSG